MRGLHGLGLENMPYAKSIDLANGTRAYKNANARDEVYKDVVVPSRPGQYVTTGRHFGSASAVLAVSHNYYGPYHDFGLSVIGGSAGGIEFGGKGDVLAYGFTGSGGAHEIARTTNFKTKVVELSTSVPQTKFGDIWSLVLPLLTFKTLQGPVERSVVHFSGVYSWTHRTVAPSHWYRSDKVWTPSSVVFYATHDQWSAHAIALTPLESVSMVGVFARYSLYEFGGTEATRPISPATSAIPFPYLLVSENAGQNYDGVIVDYMFAGCSYEWQAPGVALVSNPYGKARAAKVGGFEPANTFTATSLNGTKLLGFMVMADAPGGGSHKEYRMWRGASFDAMTRTATPAGFGSTWDGVDFVFTNTKHQAIGLIATKDGVTSIVSGPKILFVTLDYGTTWYARNLPWPQLYTGHVRAVSSRELAVHVHDGVDTVHVYISRDLGLSWSRAAAAETQVPIPTLGSLDDFGYSQQISTGTSAPPTYDPMAPDRYDYRLKPEPFNP